MKNLQFLYTLIVKTSSPYRLLSYCTLFLTVLIYQLYLQEWQQVLSVPIVLFLLYILASFIPKKSPLKRYRYAYFLIDMLACAFILWQLEFNFILSVFILSGLFFSLAFQKAPFEKFLVFFIASAWILWPSLQLPLIQHLSVFSPLLFLIYVLLLAAFIFLGIYWQNQQLVATRKKKDTYYQQMVHYMDFANQLSRYAPSQLWQAIIRGESEAKIEYKRKKLTIFFSDIQGFTQLSESLIPEDLAYLLNEYLRHMTQISRQYNATIDKFMGDGILMFFGDIDSKGIEQDAKSCVDMAIAMRQQMKILRERWQKMGYPALHIRMGITTGYSHVGNYGTADRMAYTIVGREANLAARIQSHAEVDEILISDATYQYIRDEFLCMEKPVLQVKGIADPIRTWQVVERFEATQHAHIAQRWFDYEYKGFHLILDLAEVQKMDYAELIATLEQMIERIQSQQQLDEHGALTLQHDDIVQVSSAQHPPA